jgi:hypothetical protein
LLDNVAQKPLHFWVKPFFLGAFGTESLASLSEFGRSEGWSGDHEKRSGTHRVAAPSRGAVTAEKLETVQEKLVWSIEILQLKSKLVTAIAVDAMSDRLVPEKIGER